LVVPACSAFWWKARQEERIMNRHLPEAHADYRARVRAIIPFVLWARSA
jgi:protein-S-isoprenylcysteine O-methyltransferase Ste14